MYDSSALVATDTQNSSWIPFDQSNLTEPGVGFQSAGWLYVPEGCKEKDCGLMVLPGVCDPTTGGVSESVDQFARYAEGSGIVLLHPCIGGAVDTSKYKYAKDIAAGNFDVYGQLGTGYTQQSAPHMRGVGNMIKQLLGVPIVPPALTRPLDSLETLPDASPAPSEKSTIPLIIDKSSEKSTTPGRLPTLMIDNSSVMIAGCSNTADFSHQFHVAFSSMVTVRRPLPHYPALDLTTS